MPEAKSSLDGLIFCGKTVILSPAVYAADWLECKTPQEPVQWAQLVSAKLDRTTERARSATKQQPWNATGPAELQNAHFALLSSCWLP